MLHQDLGEYVLCINFYIIQQQNDNQGMITYVDFQICKTFLKLPKNLKHAFLLTIK